MPEVPQRPQALLSADAGLVRALPSLAATRTARLQRIHRWPLQAPRVCQMRTWRMVPRFLVETRRCSMRRARPRRGVRHARDGSQASTEAAAMSERSAWAGTKSDEPTEPRNRRGGWPKGGHALLAIFRPRRRALLSRWPSARIWDLTRPLAAWSMVGSTSVWFAKWGRA